LRQGTLVQRILRQLEEMIAEIGVDLRRPSHVILLQEIEEPLQRDTAA